MSRAIVLTGLLRVTAEACTATDVPDARTEALELLLACHTADEALMKLAERIAAKHATERTASRNQHPTVPTLGRILASFDPAGRGDDPPPDDPPDDDQGAER